MLSDKSLALALVLDIIRTAFIKFLLIKKFIVRSYKGWFNNDRLNKLRLWCSCIHPKYLIINFINCFAVNSIIYIIILKLFGIRIGKLKYEISHDQITLIQEVLATLIVIIAIIAIIATTTILLIIKFINEIII